MAAGVAICAAGGMLGMLFTIPFRRALATGSALPYPEGIAAAEVLRGDTGGSRPAPMRIPAWA